MPGPRRRGADGLRVLDRELGPRRGRGGGAHARVRRARGRGRAALRRARHPLPDPVHGAGAPTARRQGGAGPARGGDGARPRPAARAEHRGLVRRAGRDRARRPDARGALRARRARRRRDRRGGGRARAAAAVAARPRGPDVGRAAALEFLAVAGRVRRTGVRGEALARLRRVRPRRRPRRVPAERPPLRPLGGPRSKILTLSRGSAGFSGPGRFRCPSNRFSDGEVSGSRGQAVGGHNSLGELKGRAVVDRAPELARRRGVRRGAREDDLVEARVRDRERVGARGVVRERERRPEAVDGDAIRARREGEDARDARRAQVRHGLPEPERDDVVVSEARARVLRVLRVRAELVDVDAAAAAADQGADLAPAERREGPGREAGLGGAAQQRVELHRARAARAPPRDEQRVRALVAVVHALARAARAQLDLGPAGRRRREVALAERAAVRPEVGPQDPAQRPRERRVDGVDVGERGGERRVVGAPLAVVADAAERVQDGWREREVEAQLRGDGRRHQPPDRAERVRAFRVRRARRRGDELELAARRPREEARPGVGERAREREAPVAREAARVDAGLADELDAQPPAQRRRRRAEQRGERVGDEPVPADAERLRAALRDVPDRVAQRAPARAEARLALLRVRGGGELRRRVVPALAGRTVEVEDALAPGVPVLAPVVALAKQRRVRGAPRVAVRGARRRRCAHERRRRGSRRARAVRRRDAELVARAGGEAVHQPRRARSVVDDAPRAGRVRAARAEHVARHGRAAVAARRAPEEADGVGPQVPGGGPSGRVGRCRRRAQRHRTRPLRPAAVVARARAELDRRAGRHAARPRLVRVAALRFDGTERAPADRRRAAAAAAGRAPVLHLVAVHDRRRVGAAGRRPRDAERGTAASAGRRP